MKKNYSMIWEGRKNDSSSNTDCRSKQMKDFTIGQVRNEVIEHGDNYYGSQTGQVGYNQSSTERRWIFRFFSRHFCIDHRYNCFPIGRLSLLSQSVLIARLIFMVSLLNLCPTRIYQSKTATFPYVEIKIRLARVALPRLPLITGLPG